MEAVDEPDHSVVDERLAAWRQGDCVVGNHWFLFRVDVDRPVTREGMIASGGRSDIVEAEVQGFAVITQTCDLVRSCKARPFVEVSPLVEVASRMLREIERGRRPNYGFIPGVAPDRFVADLDRVMTIEKGVVARWDRIVGCPADEDSRRLALALARKRARTAFPDDFVTLASPLMRRMASKHDKQSNEGHTLRALREIRVRAAPSWYADAVELTFWFIRHDDDWTFQDRDRVHCMSALPRVEPGSRFVAIDGIVQTLDDLTAREYVESDPLDLDHLTTRSK